MVFPYVMALVAKGPNADNGKKVLDFVLSDASQTMWGNAYPAPGFAGQSCRTRPRPSSCPTPTMRAPSRVDLKKLAAAQKAIIERYKNEVS